MMKWIKRLAFLLIILVVLVYLGVIFAVGPIASKVVGDFAPEIVGAPVELKDVSVSPFLNKVTVEGIAVGNPEGYKAPHAFKLDKFLVKVDLGSLATDQIIVDEILIDGALVAYETKLTESNLGAIQKNIEAFVGKSDADPKVEEEKEEAPVEEKGPGKKLLIRDFKMVNTKVAVGLTMLGGAQAIPMADIHLTDIGKESEGASIGETVKEIFDKILSSVTDVSGRAGEAISDTGKAIGDGAKKLGEGAVEGVKDAGEKVKDAGKKAIDGIKSLFE